MREELKLTTESVASYMAEFMRSKYFEVWVNLAMREREARLDVGKKNRDPYILAEIAGMDAMIDMAQKWSQKKKKIEIPEIFAQENV